MIEYMSKNKCKSSYFRQQLSNTVGMDTLTLCVYRFRCPKLDQPQGQDYYARSGDYLSCYYYDCNILVRRPTFVLHLSE